MRGISGDGEEGAPQVFAVGAIPWRLLLAAGAIPRCILLAAGNPNGGHRRRRRRARRGGGAVVRFGLLRLKYSSAGGVGGKPQGRHDLPLCVLSEELPADFGEEFRDSRGLAGGGEEDACEESFLPPENRFVSLRALVHLDFALPFFVCSADSCGAEAKECGLLDVGSGREDPAAVGPGECAGGAKSAEERAVGKAR